MYAFFKKTESEIGHRFTRGERINLFGCNLGLVPWLLGELIPQGQGEPYTWHVNIAHGLALDAVQSKFPDADTVVVDVKPSAKVEPLLCELQDVWGYSDQGWTPLLWRMKVLQVGNEAGQDHLVDFDAPDDGDTVHEFLYAQGTIHDGRLVGSWGPPKPGSANAVLLWPAALSYFIGCLGSAP